MCIYCTDHDYMITLREHKVDIGEHIVFAVSFHSAVEFLVVHWHHFASRLVQWVCIAASSE